MPDGLEAARPRRRTSRPGCAGSAFSLLESHGFIVPEDARSLTSDELAAMIAEGPLPLSLLMTLAGTCSFQGTALFELAAVSGAPGGSTRVSGSTPSHGGARGRGGEDAVREAFALVFRVLGEERGGQLDMGLAVWKALGEDGVALVEAGTGTGKSLAYLVPSVLFSRATGERVVVSTYTRNLQDQLYRREVPLLADILQIDVRAEQLIGRENYLCSRSITAAARRIAETDAARALAFSLFVALGRDGTIDSLGVLPGDVEASRLCAPPRCQMNGCGLAERCPLLRARRRAREAKLLFVNHALLLTDYRQGGGVIGPYARVIFDEAHNLERCVVENLSVKAARDDLRRILEPLGLGDREDERWKLAAHELAEAEGGLPRKRYRREVSSKAKTVERAFAEVFGGVEMSANGERSMRSARTRYVDGASVFAVASAGINALYININELSFLLKPICEADFSSDLSSFQQDVAFAVNELSTLSEAVKYLSRGCDESSVFWLDWGADGSLREICGSPVDVDRPFADYLGSFLGSVVFTSATLAEEGGFGFIKDRLGLRLLGTKPTELVVPSPFPFDEHCLILIVSGLGNPNEERFAVEVGRIVRDLSRAVRRRTLVLFTSYRLCRSASEYLGASDIEGPILAQGTGESREALSERLRRSESGILCGVASFWEGVDFPGEELEVLVIPKIPFPVPTEPIVEARAERLLSLGDDPFEKLFLPEAILRMKQGAGRLIRRMDDRGVIVILDSRLETRPYGRAVLQSLPSRNIHHVSAAECAERAAEWFRER
jgi:ATP-dependent DNA helicase DinG